MKLKVGYRALLAEAARDAEAVTPEQAGPWLREPETVFVDIRDVRELERDGLLPGALHAPRGMLEFWVDPESPYYKPVFGSGKRLVLYCASGWRSTLAAAQLTRMGVPNVRHLAGGFRAWQAHGLPVSSLRQQVRERKSSPAE